LLRHFGAITAVSPYRSAQQFRAFISGIPHRSAGSKVSELLRQMLPHRVFTSSHFSKYDPTAEAKASAVILYTQNRIKYIKYFYR